MDFVSRFTERIGSRTSREVARKKKKKGGKRNKRGMKKKEEAGGGGGGVTREKKETARRTRGKYGYFSIVIHRARISNYNDGWEKGPGPARLSVLACAKNSQDEDVALVDGGAASRILRPRIERRNDLSPSPRTCTPGEIILFPKRGPTILLHPHRSPTVELALVVAKVAAGVFEEAERGLRASRSESNSNRASWR